MPDMVQQAAQGIDKALTAGRTESHTAEVPGMFPVMACILGKLSNKLARANNKIPTETRGYGWQGGPGYPGVGAWGVSVGESPRKNIIKNEVGV